MHLPLLGLSQQASGPSQIDTALLIRSLPALICLPFWDNMTVQTRVSHYQLEHSKFEGGKISKLQKVRRT